MKRIGVPYPILLAAYPVAALYAENQAILKISDLVRPLAVAVGGTIMLWIVTSLILRNSQKAAAATSGLVLCFFAFDTVEQVVAMEAFPILTFSVWAALSLTVAALLAWKFRWHSIAGIFSAVLILIPLGKIALFQSSLVKSKVASIVTGDLKKREMPDVLFVVLDGYGRTDTFERLYGFSDREFVQGLRRRGFYIADEARANYCQTELSLSSTLNLEFVDDIENLRPVPGQIRPSFQESLEANAVRAKFESLGYQFSTIGTGFPPLSFDATQIDRSDVDGLNLLESTLIQRTPFMLRADIWTSQYFKRHKVVLDAFRSMSEWGGRRNSPRFTFAHILAPHPPFSFGENGERLRPRGPFGYWDGSDYMAHVGSLESYREGYSAQAKFVGKQVLSVIDQILATPGPRPIILIQGDHGPKMRLNQSSLEDTDLAECFPILSAYFVPSSVRMELYPEITPVNTFRTLFRVLFGEDLPNLPDRSWYSTYGRPLDLTDVTPQLSPKRT